MQYQDAAKYVINNDQPYINSIVVLSKRWIATLPPDLQKIVRDNAVKVSKDILAVCKGVLCAADQCLEEQGRRDRRAAGRGKGRR